MNGTDFRGAGTPVFYGSTTMSDRGQVVIPVEARKNLTITASTKLLVFGNPHGGGLILVKADFVSEFMTRATEMLEALTKGLQESKHNSETNEG